MGRRFRDVYTPPQYYIYNSENNRWPATGPNIQVALDDLPAAGGLVTLPEGTLIPTAVINPPAGARIAGSGMATILQLGHNGHMFTLSSVDDVIIENMRLEGLKGTYGGPNDGVYVSDVEDVLLRKLWITDFNRNGIAAGTAVGLSNRVTIHHVLIDGCDNDAIDLEPVSYVDIDGAILLNSGVSNMVLRDPVAYNPEIATVSHVYAYNAGQYNFYIEMCRAKLDQIIADVAGVNGVRVLKDEVSISNFLVRLSDQHGILLSEVDRCSVKNGISKNNSQNPVTTYSGVVLAGECLDNIVENVHAFDDQGIKTQAYGIREMNTSDFNIIKNNDVRGNQAGSLLYVGANTQITGNIGYNPQAASRPAVGASPVTFGPLAYPCFVEVVGNVTSVTIRTQASGKAAAAAFEGSWLMHPGDTCVIVYPGAAPTVTLWPQ